MSGLMELLADNFKQFRFTDEESSDIIGFTGLEAEALAGWLTPMVEELVLRRCAGEISMGSEWQVEDPRINYVDVQVDKDFYLAVRAAE